MSETSKEKTKTLANKAGVYVKDLLKKNLPDTIQYHGLGHTEDVVEACRLLGEKRELNARDMETLLLAAWFHDTGFVKATENHEEESRKIASAWLREHHADESLIEHVGALILSTKQGAAVDGPLAELLHDADLSHMGRKRFFRYGELYRVELEKAHDQHYNELDWEKSQYEFLVNNQFVTKEGKDEFGSRRVKNIKQQRENILKAQKVTTRKKTGKDLDGE